MTTKFFLLALALLPPLVAAPLFAAEAESDRVGLVKVAVDEGQAAAGLKQALMTGTADAVKLTGKPNGYFGNNAIKILLPERLKVAEKVMRTVGYGPQLDQFILSMNRAAETAAPQAEPIFERAITNMTFSDAQAIVSGTGHPATNYFRQKTSAELKAAFAPIVKQKMEKFSVVKRYDGLVAGAGPSALGGMLGGAAPNLDINDYVVQKSLDGLFYVLGQEEHQIRTKPAAQVTPLLRQVFGNL